MSEKNVSRDLETLRIAQLIANSARCSKKRLFPLENESTLRRKRLIVSNVDGGSTDHTGRDSDGGSSDSDDSRTTLGSGGPDSDKKSSERKPLGYDQAQSILGSSSSQPLRLRRQNYVDRNMNHIFRFVGDQQASTDMGMANLFGVHPARIHRVMQPDSDNGPAIQTLVNSASTQTLSYYEQPDESFHLAGVDAERPPAELLECIKSIATDKLSKQMTDKRNLKGIPESEFHADYSQLENKFDESALVAVGILVEELVRDMMINWYKTGNPLTLDPRALRTEALAQMNGSTDKDVPVSLLMNRLEVLFNKNLSDKQIDIEVCHEVAAVKTNKKASVKQNKNLNS